jgi:hypothetical protein
LTGPVVVGPDPGANSFEITPNVGVMLGAEAGDDFFQRQIVAQLSVVQRRRGAGASSGVGRSSCSSTTRSLRSEKMSLAKLATAFSNDLKLTRDFGHFRRFTSRGSSGFPPLERSQQLFVRRRGVRRRGFGLGHQFPGRGDHCGCDAGPQANFSNSQDTSTVYWQLYIGELCRVKDCPTRTDPAEEYCNLTRIGPVRISTPIPACIPERFNWPESLPAEGWTRATGQARWMNLGRGT